MMGEVVGNTSVMSFSRVPCTPITGVHVNFYDVFGDVERIGTGSSWESSSGSISSGTGMDEPLQSEGEEMKAERVRSQYCRKCKIDIFGPMQVDPHILFLQEKEEELLRELHDEIRMLKQENSDLKFQVHVILCQRQQSNSRGDSGRSKGESPILPRSENEGTLRPALEAATKMIEEFKWIQQHYEKKINMQGRMIEDLLRRQAKPSKSSESLNDLPIQVASSLQFNSQLGSPGSAVSRRYSKSGHRRSNNQTPTNQDPCEETSRRNSVQSLLPENYKDQVATLPPIMKPEALNTTAVFNSGVINASKLKHKYGQGQTGIIRNKKSSMSNLQTLALIPPNRGGVANMQSDDPDNFNYDNRSRIPK